MVDVTFLDLFKDIYRPESIGLEDFGDRLNFFTVILLLIASLIVSSKTYLINFISCFVPVMPSEKDFEKFVPAFCWARGTIPLATDELLPQTDEEWRLYDKYRRINYYQWVPFVLSLQCVLFYLPHLCWQVVCNKRTGGDLFGLVKLANESATLERSKRNEHVKRIVEFFEDMLAARQPIKRDHYKQKSCLVSKHLGSWLVFCYLTIKVLILANAFLQLYLIQHFIGFHPEGTAGLTSMQLSATINEGRKYFDSESGLPQSSDQTALTSYNFGATILSYILSGKEWPETTLFPRLAYCRIPGIASVGIKNTYTAQCALPINMLNEKVYIFLWFWIILLIFVTLISFFACLFRLVITPQRKDFIKRYLRVKDVPNYPRPGKELSRADLTGFCDIYLRRDGVFMLRMLAMNAGDLVTSEIVELLYRNYIKQFYAFSSTTPRASLESLPKREEDKALPEDGQYLPSNYV